MWAYPQGTQSAPTGAAPQTPIFRSAKQQKRGRLSWDKRPHFQNLQSTVMIQDPPENAAVLISTAPGLAECILDRVGRLWYDK